MAQVIYRDVACTTGPEALYAIVSRLLLNGWTTVAASNGSVRNTSDPASAAHFNAASAFWVGNHTASGRKLGLQRTTNAYDWRVEMTPAGKALSGGNATTMDTNASYSKVRVNGQMYPTGGTTNTKLHLVADDAACKFVALLRRSPLPGGDACNAILMEEFVDPTWPGNGDQCIYMAVFRDDNTIGPYFFSAAHGVWYKYGISGETWAPQACLENPGNICGNTASPSGVDQLLELRWNNTTYQVLYGKSTLIRGLCPSRSPIVGVDSGGTLTWAAFGAIAVPNDGIALTS